MPSQETVFSKLTLLVGYLAWRIYVGSLFSLSFSFSFVFDFCSNRMMMVLFLLQYPLSLLWLHLRPRLKVRLPTHNLRRIHRTHLIRPALRRHNLAHSPHLIRRISRNTNVVVALENDLDIADVELWRVAELAKLARVADDVVDEVVSELEDGLQSG